MTISELLTYCMTNEILSQLNGLNGVRIGQLHLLLQHTSASLTLNENCDPTVRSDMEQHFLRQVPENAGWQHDYEGAEATPRTIRFNADGFFLRLPGRLMLFPAAGFTFRQHAAHLRDLFF
ncbi:hypothetical protein CRX72_06455 [Pantoea sp. BRM17]|nr:hypothetical protein CRX72_06455 [Pantoea sp. BRM17]